MDGKEGLAGDGCEVMSKDEVFGANLVNFAAVRAVVQQAVKNMVFVLEKDELVAWLVDKSVMKKMNIVKTFE